MRKILVLFLSSLVLLPFVKADGMPYPSIRPQVKEEHQIVFVELKDNEIHTTLDLGIRNRPETAFSLLDNSIYMSVSNPYWSKTFFLPADFSPEELCFESHHFQYYRYEKSPLEVKINGNVVYLYIFTPSKFSLRCTNHAQCSRACSDVCPPNVYGCCVEGNLGQCNLKTGECYCVHDAKFCEGCPDCDYSREYCDGFSKTCKPLSTSFATEATAIHMPQRKGKIFCQLTQTEDLQNPQFVNVSDLLKPGQYNTIEIRRNVKKSFSITKIYLSGKDSKLVKIIIPFKRMPKSVEISGYGLKVWMLERPFKKEYWFGYYGDRLISGRESPELAETARRVERLTLSQVTRTRVTDASGGFEGKVSDILSEAILSGFSRVNTHDTLSFSGESFESIYGAYMEDNAYVIELDILPFELKRVTIKWVENIEGDEFQYYYPLGTGKTWIENISYTALYLKIPDEYSVKRINIKGYDEAQDGEYRYYRWKFVESTPSEDLLVDIKKLSEIESFLLSTYTPIISLAAFVVIVLVISRMS